jgi:hypothetical protein
LTDTQVLDEGIAACAQYRHLLSNAPV